MIGMDWSNERYVRLYTRDTTTMKRLRWDGRAVFWHLLRKADRAGVIDIDELDPVEGAMLHCDDIPSEVVEVGVRRMLDLGVLIHDGTRLVFPNYIPANESAQSDKQRQRESRERRAAVTKRDAQSQNVMVQSQGVTDCHAESHDVTSRHSVPSRAVPYRAEEEGAHANGQVVPWSPDSLQALVRTGFEKRFTRAKQAPPNQRALGALVRDLTPWLEQTAPLRKLSESALLEKLLDGFFADHGAAEKGYPPAFLAQNPVQYLDPPPPKPLRAAPPVPPTHGGLAYKPFPQTGGS